MPSPTTKAIFSLLGWSYVPDFITSTLLRWARPYLRTPITPLHYRLTFAFVVLSYLAYNFFEASLSTPPNFYELLGISPTSDGGQIKVAFRAFARKYHQTVFGAEILDCKECVTQRDFPRTWPRPVPWFPYRIRPCSHILFRDWKEQQRRLLALYTILWPFCIGTLLLFTPSPSSPEYQDIRYFLYFSLRVLLSNTSVSSTSIAVSRVSPVLFPDASSEASSLFVAQSAVAILEKVMNVDRELHTMVETQMLSVKPLGSKRAGDPDEHTMELLTREMEHLVIENRLTTVPAMSDLGRARSNVVKRVKAQAEERPHLRRRTLSQRSIGSGQLPSPVSPALKPFGNSQEVDVIDVDALPDEESQLKQQRVIRIERESLRPEAGPTFATHLRARSKSC
ncbi:hypothetical protein BC826DRAFT_968543 [Russula brevipes]|nr:hypothetical protein BC826DRAFT_968543 [Russula brevipes]